MYQPTSLGFSACTSFVGPRERRHFHKHCYAPPQRSRWPFPHFTCLSLLYLFRIVCGHIDCWPASKAPISTSTVMHLGRSLTSLVSKPTSVGSFAAYRSFVREQRANSHKDCHTHYERSRCWPPLSDRLRAYQLLVRREGANSSNACTPERLAFPRLFHQSRSLSIFFGERGALSHNHCS